MLGDTSREQRQALWDYGFNLGVAFQLVDDLLDYTADESALGKPIGGDLREGKVTLPIIHLLERGGEPARTLVGDIIRDKTVSREQWNELRRLLAEHSATIGALRQAQHYATLAQQHLSIFPPPPNATRSCRFRTTSCRAIASERPCRIRTAGRPNRRDR